MCTSFIHRQNDVIIAMNFDSNGMPFHIKKNDSSQFVVYVDGGRGKYPSFGVNTDGIFCNNLSVNSNGKGLYKRASKKVTHTSKLTTELLSGVIQPNEINSYLDLIEVVNGPDFSVHNMIANADGDIWIVEPGRGVIRSQACESPFFVMTNFSLCDYDGVQPPEGDGADRYVKAETLLKKFEHMTIDDAFYILESTKQHSGEWKTVFSMVYSQKEHAVFYCFDMNFNSIENFYFRENH